MHNIATAVLGLIKVHCSTKAFTIKQQVQLIFVELKSQIKAKTQSSWL